MNLLKKENLNLAIKNNFTYSFEIPEEGIYFIEIIASAKSWWQNLKSLKSFFNDDDLAAKIDDIEFPKLNGKKGLFDSEAAWNGNNLKGLSKAGIFIINLRKGNHALNFLADQNPILESISIFKIENNEEINYIPEVNNPAQDGNRRQWMAITLVNLPIKNLNIKAVARKYSNNADDDDIKLIIDGNIQKNETEKSHKNWFWCGRVSDNREKEFNQELNLTKGLHYIELWADRMPVIKSLKIIINSIEPVKIIPNADNPEWTGDFNDDPEDIILARLILGEASSQPQEAKSWVGWSVINRTQAKSWWPDTVHGVILQEGQFDPLKPKDPNFSKITNPLDFKNINEIDKKTWYECFEIAKKIILDKTNSPTEATHFHGIGITRKWFEEIVVPNGRFLKKIGDTYFYWSPN